MLEAPRVNIAINIFIEIAIQNDEWWLGTYNVFPIDTTT